MKRQAATVTNVGSTAAVAGDTLKVPHNKPLRLDSRDFHQHKYAYYAHLREHLPVHRAKVSFMNLYVTSRYEDCELVLKDERFCRNRDNIGNTRSLPLPAPIRLLMNSMINQDDPQHKRLRGLVQKAFAPKSLAQLEAPIRDLTRRLFEQLPRDTEFDLQKAYALPVPVTVIGRMMGVEAADMARLQHSIRVLSEGLSGWSLLRTLVWDMRQAISFVRELIERKRQHPADDILSQLLDAEEDGDQLSEDEVVAMVFLLIVAGYETTVHLISNGVVTLLQHPAQLQLLREQPQLLGSAVEEILRFNGPVHGTKMNYTKKKMQLRGVTIPRGSAVMPLLGAANRDAAKFVDPEVFDITRADNRHLGFSIGKHFCLGAFLARMETRAALQTLLERAPDLHLAVPPEQLRLQTMPGWHRYGAVPVRLS